MPDPVATANETTSDATADATADAAIRSVPRERTRAERLLDVREQLESQHAAVAAWAAWRVADERLTELRHDVRRAAVDWAQRNDDSTAAVIARSCLLDALIQLRVQLAPSEFDCWRKRVDARGALLVLASRVDPMPEDLLFDIFDHADQRLSRAAGELLAWKHSASAIEGLLARCRMNLRADVVEAGDDPPQWPAPFSALGLPLYPGGPGLPRFVQYDWTSDPDESSEASERASGKSAWTRRVIEPGRGSCVRIGGASPGSSSLELLRALVLDDVEPAMRVEPKALTIEFQDVPDVQRVVDDLVHAARERWSALVEALAHRRLIESDATSRSAPIDLWVRDHRANQDPPLPVFRH